MQDMQYVHLGRSGVVVSRLCLGTMNFGWKTSEEESLAIMDKALEQIFPGPGGEAPEAYAW
jgi:aryl-alcohol dehydrogenase-like predicted oxidoreductase